MLQGATISSGSGTKQPTDPDGGKKGVGSQAMWWTGHILENQLFVPDLTDPIVADSTIPTNTSVLVSRTQVFYYL